MSAKKLKDYLDSQGVKYDEISHPKKYSAQQVAASAHVSGKELAKTVIVKIKGRMAMVVLSANCRIDFALLREVVGESELELAKEHEFEGNFPDCEIGAMPPFGNLYGLDVYLSRKLAEEEYIIFKACSHTELIRMAYQDYKRLVDPIVIKFAMP